MSQVVGVKTVPTSSSSSSRFNQNVTLIGGQMEGCVVVDIQGKVAIKENTVIQPQQLPYLINEHFLGPVCFLHENDSGNRETITDVSHTKRDPNEVPSCDAARSKSSGVTIQSKFQKENLLLKIEKEDVSLNLTKRKSARKARMMLKTLNEEEEAGSLVESIKKEKSYISCRNTPKRQKTSCSLNSEMALDNLSQLPVADIPIWANKLTSVRVLDNKWLVGIASSKDILHETLEGHKRSILCDYVKSHPNNTDKRRNARDQECRVMWQFKWIVCDGVPFSMASSDDLRCTFGMNYKIKRKESLKPKDSAVKEEENITPKKMYKEVSRTSCPAKIIVKVIIKYPGYKVSPYALRPERRVMLQSLRSDLNQKRDVEKEELYYVTLPLESMHNHPFTGRSRNIHATIIAKVRALVQSGITAPKIIKNHLDSYVQLEHGQDVVVPHPEDRAYYPKLKDIGNLVYNNCRRLGIPSKQKNNSGQPSESNSKKKRYKRTHSEGDNDCDYSDGMITDTMPLQPSTLQEAVQTFCTDESDRGIISVPDQECVHDATVVQNPPQSDALRIAESIRLQLHSLHNLTYSLHEIGTLQDIHQSLQALLNQHSSVNHQNLQGSLEGSETTAAYIIQEPIINQLPTGTTALQNTTASEPGKNAGTERESYEVILSSRLRNTHVVENQHLRQVRQPLALQCIATNMVPTLTMSQLPRPSSQTSSQASAHLVSSIPSYTTVNPATVSIAQPTYQMLTPAQHDSTSVPVQLSLPPYLYYVQEVAVPDAGATNTSGNIYTH